MLRVVQLPSCVGSDAPYQYLSSFLINDRVAIDARSFAQMSKAFVISACGTVDERMIAMLEPSAEAERFLRSPDCSGGSVIVAPNSRIIAGPLGPEEGILYADCNLELSVQMKLRHDFAGHYNRPDIFHLQINRAAPKLYSVHGDGADAALTSAREAAAKLGMTSGPNALLTSSDAAMKDDDDGT